MEMARVFEFEIKNKQANKCTGWHVDLEFDIRLNY